MFTKLLKHEFKATAGLLGVLSAAALGMGVLGGFLLRLNTNAPGTLYADEAVYSIAVIALCFIMISLFAYSFGGGIYLIIRFYKSKFTDQGYLTFTLPVSVWQIYLSSLLNMMFWSLVIGLVTIIAFVSVFLIGMYDTVVWHMMQESPIPFDQIFDSFGEIFGGFGVVFAIVSFVYTSVLTLTSITLGCVAAKKHKILASIGCYYLISVVISSLTSALSTEVIFSGNTFDTNMLFLPTICVQVFVVIAGSWLTIWLMNKKLNLP